MGREFSQNIEILIFESRWEEAMDLINKNPNDSSSLFYKSFILVEMGKLEDAQDIVLDYLNNSNLQDPIHDFLFDLNLMRIFWRKKKTNKLSQIIDKNYQISDIFENQNDFNKNLWSGYYYNLIALFNWNRQEYDKALKYYDLSLEQFGRLENKGRKAIPLHNMGLIYKHQGKYEEALNYFEASAEMFQENNQTKNVAIAYNNIGLMYMNVDDLENAKHYFMEVKNLPVIETIPHIRAECYMNIGIVFKYTNDLKLSLQFTKKALKIWEDLDSHLQMGATLSNLGSIYTLMGQYGLAISTLNDAIAKNSKFDNQIYTNSAISNLGLVYQAQGKFEEAINCYYQINHQTKISSYTTYTSYNYMFMGYIDAVRGNTTQALNYLKKSFDDVDKVYSRIKSSIILFYNFVISYRIQEYKFALQIFEVIREINNNVDNSLVIYLEKLMRTLLTMIQEEPINSKEIISTLNEILTSDIEIIDIKATAALQLIDFYLKLLKKDPSIRNLSNVEEIIGIYETLIADQNSSIKEVDIIILKSKLQLIKSNHQQAFALLLDALKISKENNYKFLSEYCQQEYDKYNSSMRNSDLSSQQNISLKQRIENSDIFHYMIRRGSSRDSLPFI